MNKLIVFLLTLSLVVGGTTAAQAQRGYPHSRVIAPPRGAYGYRQSYRPRYYHESPYRSYGGRAYYRPRPYYGRPRYYRHSEYRRGPAVIIRH
jgi:hypothetical protein